MVGVERVISLVNLEPGEYLVEPKPRWSSAVPFV